MQIQKKCEKEALNRLECELSGSVVVFRNRKTSAYPSGGVSDETVRGDESGSVGGDMKCRAFNETERA